MVFSIMFHSFPFSLGLLLEDFLFSCISLFYLNELFDYQRLEKSFMLVLVTFVMFHSFELRASANLYMNVFFGYVCRPIYTENNYMGAHIYTYVGGISDAGFYSQF